MAVITFDALKFVERLTAAGIPDAQAKAEASALRDALMEALDTTIATKGDITRLENKIDKLEASTKADMQALELRLIIKLGALITAAVGILIAVLRVSH
ncbi:conserved hypothetical protein [Gammaproteobacteria bacterium]